MRQSESQVHTSKQVLHFLQCERPWSALRISRSQAHELIHGCKPSESNHDELLCLLPAAEPRGVVAIAIGIFSCRLAAGAVLLACPRVGARVCRAFLGSGGARRAAVITCRQNRDYYVRFKPWLQE